LILAGRLVPGDRVVSARLGTVRAYVVGTDQVLVHNGKCKDPAETARELEEAERELEDLQLKLSLSIEDEATLKQQIELLEHEVNNPAPLSVRGSSKVPSQRQVLATGISQLPGWLTSGAAGPGFCSSRFDGSPPQLPAQCGLRRPPPRGPLIRRKMQANCRGSWLRSIG
jgi:hypothetical protein